jgi:monovalent cation/hydrogen antiporter
MLIDQFTIYIGLLAVIVLVSAVFRNSAIPISLLMVFAGMLISLVPGFPDIKLNPGVILNIFLPLLLYQAAAYVSWRDFKKNLRAIFWLSIGHVFFITVLVAVTMHYLIPGLSWPLAFVLGAVISPPDDVAIIAIAEKIHFPRRILTVLTGEGLLNDATALTLFRFALAAVMLNTFSPWHAAGTFFAVLIGETLFGLCVGNAMGQLRMRIPNSTLQILISFITPFIAFIIPEKCGGSGVIATVVAGIVIGTRYVERFQPDVRLAARAVWTTIGFALQNILFLLVGLDLRFNFERISVLPTADILLYTVSVCLVVILGRFVWVFSASYFPRFLFPILHKDSPNPPWQYPFIISWAGMRGGISLAAALAVPYLPSTIDGVNPRDLLVFLVISVIAVTLLFQGLTLPWLLKVLGVTAHGEREKYKSHLAELTARLEITKVVIRWLLNYELAVKHDETLHEEAKLRIKEYKNLKTHLQMRIKHHDKTEHPDHDHELELEESLFLSTQLIEIERSIVSQLWEKNRIDHAIKTKLILQLDHREKQLAGYA